jgi:hypothetical protein
MTEELDTREATEDEGDHEYDDDVVEAPLDPDYLARLIKEAD